MLYHFKYGTLERKMSKLEKPNHIIFIGTNLYTDYIQYAYLKRVFPYIKDATHVGRYQTLNPQVFKEILEDIKLVNQNSTIFVIDFLYTELLKYLTENKIELNEKNSSVLFSIDSIQVAAKKVSLFKQLPESAVMVNSNMAYFKAFGKCDSLEEMQKELSNHASMTKILPNCYSIILKDAQGEKILTEAAKRLNLKILAVASLKQALVKYFSAKNKTISIAESCTGGLLATKLTSVSGASKIIEGTMVTYSNEIKHKWLGVSKETLDNYGAVSKECVSEMLDGIQKVANSSIAVAISGIAGPTGGSEEKPVGTVFIGILNGDKKNIQEFHFEGDRTFIRELSARTAIEMIIESEDGFFEFF